jgi:hypothetical protein
MHHAILQEVAVRYKDGATPPPTQSVKFVANAAGGLVSRPCCMHLPMTMTSIINNDF